MASGKTKSKGQLHKRFGVPANPAATKAKGRKCGLLSQKRAQLANGTARASRKTATTRAGRRGGK